MTAGFQWAPCPDLLLPSDSFPRPNGGGSPCFFAFTGGFFWGFIGDSAQPDRLPDRAEATRETSQLGPETLRSLWWVEVRARADFRGLCVRARADFRGLCARARARGFPRPVRAATRAWRRVRADFRNTSTRSRHARADCGHMCEAKPTRARGFPSAPLPPYCGCARISAACARPWRACARISAPCGYPGLRARADFRGPWVPGPARARGFLRPPSA